MVRGFRKKPCAAGSPTVSTINRRFRSKTRRCSPTAVIAKRAGCGFNAFSIMMARTVCGPVCNRWPDVLSFKPPVKADRLTEKALKLERKGNHSRAAECYRAALDHAEGALGTDHGYLAWVLVRYWLALRHAGQHDRAARIKPRADAMWAKYGQGHLSD